MRDSALDPPALPDAFWVRPDVRQSLVRRDIGELFRLLRQHAGMSQIRIGTAVGLAQVRVSLIARDRQTVTSSAVLTRIADGLGMPDHARTCLGIAPQQAGEDLSKQRRSVRRLWPGCRVAAAHLQRQVRRCHGDPASSG